MYRSKTMTLKPQMKHLMRLAPNPPVFAKENVAMIREYLLILIKDENKLALTCEGAVERKQGGEGMLLGGLCWEGFEAAAATSGMTLATTKAFGKGGTVGVSMGRDGEEGDWVGLCGAGWIRIFIPSSGGGGRSRSFLGGSNGCSGGGDICKGVGKGGVMDCWLGWSACR